MSSILFEIKEQVGIIRLNRPEKLNAFNRVMALELQARLDDCEKIPEIRSVLITGEGKGFSAGQDLAEVVDPEGPSMAAILSEHYNPIVKRIRMLGKPVIAAVNGVAAGAGANIALSCDIVLATQSAFFIQAFSKIGLIPDSGGTFFLPRLVGWQKASGLAMLGDKVSAEEADRMGMIYAMIPDDQFTVKSGEIAKKMAMMPTRSFALTKRALNYSFTNNFEEQLEMEDKLQQEAAHTADYREGVAAFLEKRTPVFKGE